MKAIKVDEMIYVIESETKGQLQNYAVKLLDNSKRGSCTCDQFKFRIYPNWKKGNKYEPCKHLMLALGHAAWHSVHE